MNIVSQKEQTTVEKSAKIQFNKEDIINAFAALNDRTTSKEEMHPSIPDDARIYVSIPGHGNVYIGDDDELMLTVEFESKVVS